MSDNLLTTAQAAEILGVSTRRVQAMIKDGLLPKSQKIGRDWLLDEKEVRELATKERLAHRPKKGKR
jgi:excisionase family DNA binding protein